MPNKNPHAPQPKRHPLVVSLPKRPQPKLITGSSTSSPAKSSLIKGSTANPRVDIHEILNDKQMRRELCIRGIMAIQGTAGIRTTYEQAAAAYDKVILEKQLKK